MAAQEFITNPLFSDANCVAYYKLENVNDSKASYTLTNNNTCTFVSAKFNNGVSSGTTDANKTLSINNTLGYTGGAYSISLWMKVNTTLTTNQVYSVCWIDENTHDTALNITYRDTSGTLYFQTGRSKWGVTGDNDTYAVDLGTTLYHHAVVVYDGSTVKGYLNGVEVNSISSTGNGTAGGTDRFAILGQTNDLTANNFLGIVDDVALFSRALTATEVLRIYETQVGGYFHMSV